VLQDELRYSFIVMLCCFRSVNSLFFSVARHVVGTETNLELIPRNIVDICVGVVVRLPTIHCCSKELVHGKKSFLMIRALDDHELRLNSLEPILNFHGVICLRERGGASS
jgi:hypothetical protein